MEASLGKGWSPCVDCSTPAPLTRPMAWDDPTSQTAGRFLDTGPQASYSVSSSTPLWPRLSSHLN